MIAPGRLIAPACACAAGCLLFVLGCAPLFAAGCSVIVAAAIRAGSRRREVAARTALARASTVAHRALAAELRAGRAPAEAVRAVSIDAPASLREPLRGIELLFAGQEIAPSPPGVTPAVFAELAAAWRVCAVTGAGLAAAATDIAQVRVAQERQRQEVASALASAEASAGVLAGLPLLGLFGATAVGASPVPWLMHSAAGGAAFLAGTLLDTAGLAWVRRLGSRALRSC